MWTQLVFKVMKFGSGFKRFDLFFFYQTAIPFFVDFYSSTYNDKAE